MRTIKLGKIGWIILAIAILLHYSFVLTTNNEKEQNKEGRLARLLKRWQELQREIQNEINDLRLTREMEALLEQKISRLLVIGKTIFIILFTIITYGFYLRGLDLATSLLTSAGIITFICCAVSFLKVSRFADANEMINAGRDFIKRIIYKSISSPQQGFKFYKEVLP
ncbi:MAG: hypothetical protein IPK96_11610 [Flammeovirgaceae bacterium]|nr:hypothetical protein [Flammeovirgaceae bacterium]